ncbi:MAG: hypothetical protein IT323_00590 [Anaerolineae bacterium]|nr:hypothetical protein [Anaerolineae bacterium]
MIHTLFQPLDEVQTLYQTLLAGAHGPLTQAQRTSIETATGCAGQLRDLVTSMPDAPKLRMRTLVIAIYSGAEMLIRGAGGPLNAPQLEEAKRIRDLATTLRKIVDGAGNAKSD